MGTLRATSPLVEHAVSARPRRELAHRRQLRSDIGPVAYSALCSAADGAICCLYERGAPGGVSFYSGADRLP